jgi:hypothetical protein
MAVTSLLCAGSNWNTVSRVLATTSGQLTTSDNNTLFPPAYLGDYFSALAFRFNSTSTGTITLDCNLVPNGTMENAASSGATVLANWIVDSGTISRTSSTVFAGSWAMQLGAGGGTAHVNVLVNTGERFTVFGAARGDGAGSAAKLQVQNLMTLNYLTSSGAWQAAQTYCLSNSSAAYATASITGTIESYGPTRLSDTMVLQFQVTSTGGTVFADDILYWPSTSVISLHGFLNIDPSITITALSSTDNFTSATTEATLTNYRPSFFYAPTSPIDRRYIRVKFANVNSSTTGSPAGSGPIYGGELCVGQPTTITRGFNMNYPLIFEDAQERETSVLGDTRVYRLSSHAIRKVNLGYVFDSIANYQQARDLVRRAQFGASVSLLIPSSTDPEVCILGRIEETWTASQGPMIGYFEGAKLAIVEMPFPVWVT